METPKNEPLPPEWEALVLAARQIEIENAQERERADRLNRELEKLRAQAAAAPAKIPGIESLEATVRDLKAEIESLKEVIRGMQILFEESKRIKQDLIEARDKLGGALSQNPQQSSVSDRGQFAESVRRMLSEVHHLKQVLPTETALTLKQAEVEKLKKVYQRLSPNHGERKAIEALLKAQIVERDRIREVHEKVIARLENDESQLQDLERQATSSPNA